MSEKNELALIQPEDLSLVDKNSLNANQLQLVLKKTPAQYIKKRPAKGGGTWNYVTGGYVKKCLNLLFGWNWSFEILENQIMHGEVVVKGKLTCHSNGATIVKMQYGNKDIVYKKNTTDPLSIGNDLKAAATDCLKKCASEIGIAADIYNAEEFKEVQVNVPKKEKPTLTKSMAAYQECVKHLLEGGTIKDIEKRYLLTDEIREELLSDSI